MDSQGTRSGPSRFFWQAHPGRALVESWMLGLAILFLLSLLVGKVSPFVLSNGLLLLCGVSGMWAVLRVRLPQGSWIRQILWEGTVGIALSLTMTVGLRLPAYLLGWEEIWQQANLGNTTLLTVLLLAIGPGYWLARVGVRLWLAWGRMRRQRMLWAMTHTQLTVVAVVAVIGALVLVLMISFTAPQTLHLSESSNWFAALASRLLNTLLPAMVAVTFMIGLILVILLPPSALFSYLTARRTTRRLESLADTARALRQGDYGARVTVTGEDEVSQLQSDFNAMADDLERTLGELQAQRDRVADLLEARRDLVANVSHELRTPVATVRATLESTLGGWPDTEPDDLHHDLEVMNGEIVRLQALIDDLFTLARSDAGGLALDCRPIDVVPTLQQMVEALAPLAWRSGRVQVVAELPAEPLLAQADPSRLAQILTNLLRNGIRHTPPGGIVAASACHEAGSVRIDVRDTGQGIDQDDLPRIWDRFYRGRPPANAGRGGAGLGLTLVKELAEAMGGRVAVDSLPGQGSCFRVWLPQACLPD